MKITTANASNLFVAQVLKVVYQKELNFVTRHVEKLYKDFRNQGNTDIAGFLYMGAEYRFHSAGRLQSLPPQYRAEIDAVLKDKMEVVNYEQPFLTHFLIQILRKTKNVYSIKQIFPYELHKYVGHYLSVFEDDVELTDEELEPFKTSKVLEEMKFRLAFNTVL